MATAVESDVSGIEQLLSFAKRQVRTNPNYRHPLDRRQEERKHLVVPAVIQAVTSCLGVLESPIKAVTRDISVSGIGLVSGDQLKHDFYTVKLMAGDEQIHILGLKAWTVARGPYDFVGMDIVRKLDQV